MILGILEKVSGGKKGGVAMSWKWILIVIILLLLVIFTAQNYETVQIKFLIWSFKSSSAISIFVSLVVGFLIGLLMNVKGERSQDHE